jgi:tRNA(fMet)-specific endonuclease VapC
MKTVYFSELKLDLKRAGTPLPENDIWIAAVARTHNLTVVSRDQHFVSIKAIAYEIW